MRLDSAVRGSELGTGASRKPGHGDGGDTIIAFANRLPVRRTAHGWHPSHGGLVAALRPALENRRSTWVGWNPSDTPVPKTVEGLDVHLRAVELSRRDVAGSYHGFANRTLWPLLHGLVEQPVYNRAWWDAYRDTNERFARADPGGPGIRWVHDYHLLLLPALLRERTGGREPIGLFLHIPFPPPEIFARLPWRAAALNGMLGADVISFHVASYRDNFLRSCARLVDDAIVERTGLRLADGRWVETAVNPISIDSASFTEAAATAPVQRRLARLREQFAGRRVLLGIDRLDYTKGIPERLRALELLLELVPNRRRELAFVQIAIPSRGEIREYDELRSTVERLVGRINGRFTETGRDVPVHYLHRGVPHEELLAYYLLADTCVVTPLQDGMNLVAKEFIVTQHAMRGSGALVLSEFAGAVAELKEALPCNPFDVEGLAGTLELALQLSAEDRRHRLQKMADTIVRHDLSRWVEQELGALRTRRA